MVTNPTDTDRGLKFDSPLGDDLICVSFSGQEKLGRLFDYKLDLLSPNPDIQFQDIVGQRVTVSMELSEGDRYFNGYIAEFTYMGDSGQFAAYQATMKPWFWFLTRTSDCRIFQNQKVPDIIKSVFRDNGMSDFKDRLSDSYRTWDYCVQYRETDFNFVSRLMEQEGIYYFFEHIQGKHTLVLADSIGGHEPFPGYDEVPYFPPDPNAALRERDHIQHWVVTQTIVPGKYAIKDFDFEKPKVNLTAKLSTSPPHAYPIEDHEIFDYPGEYTKLTDGNAYVGRKLQELQAQHERVQANGNARGMSAGCLFTLENYPRSDQNKEYLIISVQHDIKSDALETTGGGGAEDFYHCQLEVMSSARQYRSERITPKPIVQGPQTAIVVGPEGDEIYCDEYARVKVQFHWDRYGENDQNSSCWVRVSQVWAGKAWGGIHIPRIGQEVLVSFLEGDPDRPVITGRVYNAQNITPTTLPDEKVISGMKSNSTPGGGGYNEIIMDDSKGKEELNTHAQYDMNTSVLHDKSTTVKNDHSIVVVEGNDTHGVSAGTRSVTVKGDTSLTVQAGTRTVSVSGGDYSCTTDATIGLNAKDDINLIAGTYITLNAQAIVIEGVTIELKTAGGNILLDGSGVTINGTQITSSAKGTNKVTGSLVLIN